MSAVPLRLAAAAVVIAGATAGAVTYAASAVTPSGSAVVDTAAPGVAATSFPGLAAPAGDPVLSGLDTARPAAGRIEQVAGPFDDRFVLSRLRLGDGRVAGRVRVTSDVSEVLELQVAVGFYDAQGTFLGSGATAYHLDESQEAPDEGPPSEVSDFRVVAPASYAARVAAATVGVPVLVNE